MFGSIGKFLFGGEDTSGQDASRESRAESIDYLNTSKDQALRNANNLSPSIENNLNEGQRQAFNLLQMLMPAQESAQRQASLGAQRAITQGNNNARNAILGLPMSGGVDPVQVNVARPEMQYPQFKSTSDTLRNQSIVEQLYQELLGRAPDSEGDMYWTGQVNNGLSPDLLRQLFQGSSEYSGQNQPQPAQVRDNSIFNGRGP